jgi:photosystem II stability/assembly factor-like uncharacterized protein
MHLCLYVSTDYGSSWTQLNLNGDVCSMIFKNGFLIAVCDNAVFRSADFGNTWEQSDVSFPEMYYPEITAYGNDLYLAGRYGLYRSPDDAQTWTQLNSPTTGFMNSVAFSNDNLFLASDSGLFKSSDFGISWERADLGSNLSIFTQVKSSGNILLTGTFLSLYRSSDNGFTWESPNFGFNRESISQIAAYGTGVIAGLSRGIYASGHNGDLWAESENNRQRSGITAIDISGNLIYAGMYDGRLLKSDDNGSSWIEIPNNSSSGFRITAVDVNGEQILYGSTRNSAPVGGGIHYSSNGGLNWLPLGGSKYGVTDAAINNNYLYAASPLCLRGKDVSSADWDTLISYGTYGIEISQNYVFAYTLHGLKRSSDNGMTWTDITNGLDTSSAFNDMLYFNNKLYIAFNSIYVSTNDGDQWYSINDGLTDTTITKLAINDKYLFAATGSGVWRRPADLLVKVPSKNAGIPFKYSLAQNYPNPFNPSTKIKFDIPSNVKSEKRDVKIVIYDILGKEVAVLVNESLLPGSYEISWDASSYTSGVYLCKLTAGEYFETKKMILVK